MTTDRNDRLQLGRSDRNDERRTDRKDKPSREGSPTRRRILQGAAGLAAAGVAGCLGTITGGCDGIAVEGPEGETNCVAAVEGDGPIADYYGYDTENSASVATPDGLAVENALVTFVYRNAQTGDRHLVFVLDHPDGDDGGTLPMTFRGVSGYEWTVLDDNTGNDGYRTPDGTFDEFESVAWEWNDNRTDGGAFGALEEGFDVELASLAEGSAGGKRVGRSGLDRWVVLDGGDGESVEVATFDDGGGGDGGGGDDGGDGTGDVSIRVSG